MSVNKRLKKLSELNFSRGVAWAQRCWKYYLYFDSRFCLHYFFFLTLGSKTTPHGRVWWLFMAEKWVVLLRCLYLIGQGSPLKHQYLNQVKKKVREETDSTLSVVPSGPREDRFQHVCSLICIEFTDSLGS